MDKRDHIPVRRNGPGRVVRSGGYGLRRAGGDTFLWALGPREVFRFFRVCLHVAETCLPDIYIHWLPKETEVMKEREKVRQAWGGVCSDCRLRLCDLGRAAGRPCPPPWPCL